MGDVVHTALDPAGSMGIGPTAGGQIGNPKQDPLGYGYMQGMQGLSNWMGAGRNQRDPVADFQAIQNATATRQDQLAQQMAAARQSDMSSGQALGQQLFGNDALGRIDPNRAPEMQAALAQQQAFSQGFTPEEQNAMRSQMLGGITRSGQTAERNLRGAQGAYGLTGGAAAMQQARLQTQLANQRAQAEQQAFINNIAMKRQALGQYQQMLGGQEQSEQQRQAFNLQQLAREKFGQLGTQLGVAGLGVAERTGAAQQAAAEQQAAQAYLGANSGSQGLLTRMFGGLF